MTKEHKIESCVSCIFYTNVIDASQYKKKSGPLVHNCRHYGRELPSPLGFNEKADFCKVIKITIEESN